uniref:N-acyl-aliphatic-L-amino acid amidohydrolase n=1 Tax=Heterorhabditis bacteriophora TaxID=37862 RepID=A0A1I7X080_HETBA
MAEEDIAVTMFRKYLRVNTEHPRPDYEVWQGTALYKCYEIALALNIHCYNFIMKRFGKKIFYENKYSLARCSSCILKYSFSAACQTFLFELADELRIERRSVEVKKIRKKIYDRSNQETNLQTAPGKMFVIMTITGFQPSLQSLALYSHTDVVPTFKEHWKYDPYAAHKDEKGDIYGRGAQDMKCVGSQYFEAIRRHFLRGKKQWKRTIHLIWGPGLSIKYIFFFKQLFGILRKMYLSDLNIGFVLDEGLASETSTYLVYYAERCPWWVKITCEGSPGHGSKFIENTAAEKIQSVINSSLAFREEQKNILSADSTKTLGDVTTLNMTMIDGGVQINVLPEKLNAFFDIRIPPTIDFCEVETKIAEWCQKAGPGVKYEFLQKNVCKNMTPTSMSDPWWKAFSNSLRAESVYIVEILVLSIHHAGCEFSTEIFTGATDSRFIRELGYRSIGFSPMINTPSLLHDHNEYLNEKVFLRGVEIYETLIDNLANENLFLFKFRLKWPVNSSCIMIMSAVPAKPFIIMTIPGQLPLPSLVLYSHTDVVPTFKEHWKYDPYAAHKDEKGDIYGRGAQDMKCVGSQYFEAIRRHFLRGKKQWKRTIHLIWGPDEEIGAIDGMEKFCKMQEFHDLNIGFVLDEGLASETDQYKVYYAERNPWWTKIICEGSPGHGSKFIENTAAEKLQSIINSALEFREEQRAILKNNPEKSVGDVITLNVTKIQGGVQINVLPEEFVVELDIRVPPTANFDEVEAMIAGWCQKAGPRVRHEYIVKTEVKNMTPTTMDDAFWAAFDKSLKKEGCNFDKEIFTGATDSRFLRELGYRSIGFSPMINTPSLLHDHNEYLNEKVFLRGVEIYETLIDNLANVEE